MMKKTGPRRRFLATRNTSERTPINMHWTLLSRPTSPWIGIPSVSRYCRRSNHMPNYISLERVHTSVVAGAKAAAEATRRAETTAENFMVGYTERYSIVTIRMMASNRGRYPDALTSSARPSPVIQEICCCIGFDARDTFKIRRSLDSRWDRENNAASVVPPPRCISEIQQPAAVGVAVPIRSSESIGKKDVVCCQQNI